MEAVVGDDGEGDDSGDRWEVVARNDGEEDDGGDRHEMVLRRERRILASLFFEGLCKGKHLKDIQMPVPVRMGINAAVEMSGRS